MVLKGALHPLPSGHVGTVVTYLEMTERSEGPIPPESPLRLERWSHIEPEAYRRLFRKVGGNWLWFSRLTLADRALLDAVGEVHEVTDSEGHQAGMLELDFREPGECLIRFLGLVPPLAGKGHGRWLFAMTMKLAWKAGIERVRVNTCTLDHPAALPSYLRAGFKAYARAFESFPDPRLSGILPKDFAPQIPLLA